MIRNNKKLEEPGDKARKTFACPYTRQKHSEFLEIVKNNKPDPLERNEPLISSCWIMLSIGFGIAAPFIYKNGFEQIHAVEGIVKAVLLTFFSFISFFSIGGIAALLLYMCLGLLKKRRIARKAGLLFPQFSLKRHMELLEKCHEDAKGPFSSDGELLYEMFKSRYQNMVFDAAAEEILRAERRKKFNEFIARKKKALKQLPKASEKVWEIIEERKRSAQEAAENFVQERKERKLQELKEKKEQEKAEIERMEKYLEKNSIDLRLDLRKEKTDEKI